MLAFQTDATRVATFVYANEGSNRSYRHINVPEGHHDLSHHAGNAEKLDKIRRINRFHIAQFAYLLDKLRTVREGDGTLLDNCMILYGSGNGDGNRHNHDNLPILLAGKGGGTLTTGRHVVYPRETPLTNLYLSLLERMGVQVDSFGDSTGRPDEPLTSTSFPRLAWNARSDALRPVCLGLGARGRRASGRAFPRRAWERENPISAIITRRAVRCMKRSQPDARWAAISTTLQRH